MKKRLEYFVRVVAIYSLFLAISNVCALAGFFDNDSTSSIWDFKNSRFVQPLTGTTEHLVSINNFPSVSKLNFGFCSEYLHIDHGHEGSYRKNKTLEICNIGLGYKYYNNKENNNIPFVDFSLFKLKTTFPFFIYLGSSLNIFEKKTTWFSNNYIDWVKGGILFGISSSFSGADISFEMIVHLNLGFTTFYPDTIALRNLHNNYRKYNYRLGELNSYLNLNYNEFHIEISTTVSDGIGKNAFRTPACGSVKLYYTFWKDRTFTNADVKDYHAFPKIFQIYLGYSEYELALSSDDRVNSQNSPYHYANKMLNIGIII